MARIRINFLSVPIDAVEPSELGSELMKCVHTGDFSQICFVSIWDVLRARTNPEYLNCLKKASLVLPISKSIIRGAAFLKLPIPHRYNPFNAVISILGELDKNFCTLYLLGGRKETLKTTEKNIRITFPNIHIVGRYVGYYSKNTEPLILEAVRKASPSLVLIADGIKGNHLWAYKRKKHFNASIFLNYKDSFRIFSKRKKRISSNIFDKGLEIWVEIIRNPLKIFLIFPFIAYFFILLWYRCFRSHK